MQETQEMRLSGLGGPHGGGHGNPLQYSCVENPLDRGSLQVTVHRVAKNWTLEQLSMYTCMAVNASIIHTWK